MKIHIQSPRKIFGLNPPRSAAFNRSKLNNTTLTKILKDGRARTARELEWREPRLQAVTTDGGENIQR